MVDQNPQVNQNVNNQNENDELFGGSDDIFENSDLLQPINSEVDTTHQVIKSQNDLNNFSGEIQNETQGQAQQVITETQPEQIDQNVVTDTAENINDNQIDSDDLFEQSQVEQNNGDEHLNTLYDNEENSQTTDDLGINDDIFESSEPKEQISDIPEVPEIVEDIDEPEEIEQVQEEVKDTKPVETVSQPENNATENTLEDDEDFQNDLETLNELDNNDEEDDTREDENEDASKVPENAEERMEDDEKKTEDGVDKIGESKDYKNEKEYDEEEIGMASEDQSTEAEENNDTFENFNDEEQQETRKIAEEELETTTVQDYEKYDPNLFKTDIQKKFGELQWKTEKIHELVGKDQDVGFDLLGGNDDRKKIIYRILSGSDYVEIEKEELNKEDESTTTNTLGFVLEENFEQNMSLQLFVNDVELYDEIRDFQNDPNKKMQVLEKMNKFIFLLDEEYKRIQKYKKEKEEKNAVKGIFRNF